GSLVTLLSVVWGVSAERVVGELAREMDRPAARDDGRRPFGGEEDEPGAEVVSLDGWRRRGGRRRRTRVDARRGRGPRRGGRAA
ncbi:MAG TPA: hypothetical protein VF263_12100, partial [Longimicrobiaceae bacterium]